MKDQLFKLNPRDYIFKSREKGNDDQSIYNELTTRFEDKKAIAKLIIGSPTPEAKKKNKNLNTLLFALIATTIVFKIITAFLLTFNQGGLFAGLFIFIYPLINIYIAFGVFNYLPTVYNLGAILSLISCFKILLGIKENLIYGSIDLLLAATMLMLFFKLKDNLFPNYKPNDLKTDSAGHYIIDTTS